MQRLRRRRPLGQCIDRFPVTRLSLRITNSCNAVQATRWCVFIAFDCPAAMTQSSGALRCCYLLR
jgi:hypothetical protein